MNIYPNRRKFVAAILYLLNWITLGKLFAQQPKSPGKKGNNAGSYVLPSALSSYDRLSIILGRVTDRSIVVSALSKDKAEIYLDYGYSSGKYTQKTKVYSLAAQEPLEFTLEELKPDTEYFFRVQLRKSGEKTYTPRDENRFHTQRVKGSTFTFAVQGDSHPERPQMSEPNLYARTLLEAARTQPDFYICIGDDFSVDKVKNHTPEGFAEPYTLQRPFLGLVGQTAPIYLVNGNHEQGSLFNYNQKDVRHAVAVGVQKARNKYYPMPEPDAFYKGNSEPLKEIGLLRDYYSWTWGDALFVVLDNYWHSPTLVDSGFAGGTEGKEDKKSKEGDWWGKTLGDMQYKWFKKILEESTAKYKFVFAHHVLGSGRGGIDQCDLFEWGGKNKRGDWEFKQKRPGWEMPIHQLMVKHKVTIFFQGHDHLYAKQEKDGIIYQELPMPSDHGYVAYNEDRYKTGVKLPNSGFLKVTVSPSEVKVEYVRTYLPKDESDKRRSGEIAHNYQISSRSASQKS